MKMSVEINQFFNISAMPSLYLGNSSPSDTEADEIIMIIEETEENCSPVSSEIEQTNSTLSLKNDDNMTGISPKNQLYDPSLIKSDCCARLNDLESENEALKQQISVYETNDKKLNLTIQELKDLNNVFKDKISSLTESNHELKKEIHDLRIVIKLQETTYPNLMKQQQNAGIS